MRTRSHVTPLLVVLIFSSFNLVPSILASDVSIGRKGGPVARRELFSQKFKFLCKGEELQDEIWNSSLEKCRGECSSNRFCGAFTYDTKKRTCQLRVRCDGGVVFQTDIHSEIKMGDVDPLPGSAPPPTETDSKADPLVETFERLGGTRELVAERGCSASSNLPFNLGACQCDGAILGELVGAEACRQVVARCSLLVGFSADISIGEVQNSCDKLAADSCIKSAQDVGLNNSICLSILQNGDGRCDDAMAKQLFEEEVTKLCRPACPDCSRLN